ncbi:MAG TPA: sigma-54 dependent transcriptional regulator [Thermoanaerobaculia bacterium]
MAKIIVLLDLERPPCQNPGCDRLAGLLRSALSPGELVVKPAVGLLPPWAGDRPDLLVVRSPSVAGWERWAESDASDARGWEAVPTLGILCGPVRALPESLLARLDDFLCCPPREVDLALRVRRLLGPPRTPEPWPAGSRSGLEALIGESPAFLRVIDRIPLLAGADAAVMITGETGTGKELVARALHYRSPRRGRPFVPLNCGAMPETLVENELFGHVRGAFTDAASNEAGLLAEADGGTLFLDEVDALGAAAQVKLLRFLQTWEYRPLGSPRTRRADLRVIAATNADLPGLVAERRFRQDLFYRLDVLRLHLPPLRERPGDVALLARRFVERYAARHGRPHLHLSPLSLARLSQHAWPGNVRELEAVVQRAVLLSPGPVLRPEDLDLPAGGSVSGATAAGGSLRQMRDRAVELAERTCLIGALAANGGNVSRAARSVGKERRAFQRLMRKHAIERAAFL